jgi:hypothetical protein
VSWHRGTTRPVWCVGNWAIKFPNFLNGWPHGLRGLLGNLQEAEFSSTGWDSLCPVLWSLPGGLLLVMRRARELTWDERRHIDASRLDGVPVEWKPSSFGWLDGRVVAIDYGS